LIEWGRPEGRDLVKQFFRCLVLFHFFNSPAALGFNIKDVGPEVKLNTKKQFANKRKRDDEKEEEEGKTEKWKKI